MSSILCAALLALATLAATAVGGAPETLLAVGAEDVPASLNDASSSIGSFKQSEATVLMSLLEVEVRALTGLDEAGIEARLVNSSRDQRDLRNRALLALAGRDVPPGFPAAWGQRRDSERAPARAYLRQRLDDPRSAAGWRGLIRSILEDPNSADELWSATARLVADFTLFGMTPVLASVLDLPEFTIPEGQEADLPLVHSAKVRRSVARRALHSLYRLWFEDEASVRFLYDQLDEFRDNNVFRQALIETDRVALDRLRRLVELRPQDATSRLLDPDPRVKAHAAAAVARAVGETVTDPEEAIDNLLIELRTSVHDAGVFHAVLESLIEILASAPASSEPLRELRTALQEALSSGASPGVRISIASGLSRLPWGGADAEEGDGAEAGLRSLAGMVEGLVEWRPLRDDDEIVFVLQSLLSLGGRASAKGIDVRAVVGSLRGPLSILFYDGDLKPDVRSAAARALATFVPLNDLGELVERLGESGESRVPHLELIGALERIGPELEVDSIEADQLMGVLVPALGDFNSDLRRKALDVLRDRKMAKHTSRVPVARWLSLLESEIVPALRLGLLDLVRISGNPEEDLSAIWVSPSFGRVVTEDARVFGGLVDLLREWCDGSLTRVTDATDRLLAIEAVGLRAERLAATLQLTADLDAASARDYEVEQACALLDRAAELRRADRSALLAISTQEGRPYIERLLRPEVLEGCSQVSKDQASFESLRRVALLSADLWGVDPEALSVELVAARFGAATQKVQLPGGPSVPGSPAGSEALRPGAQLLRERARFYSAAGREASAVSDFTLVFHFDEGLGGEDLEEENPPLLSNSDLRRAAELQHSLRQEASLQPVATREGDVVPPGGDRSRQGTAADFMDVLLARPGWLQEPTETRFTDLLFRLELVELDGSASETAKLSNLLSSLPPLPLTGPLPEPSTEEIETPAPEDSSVLPPKLEGLVEDYECLHQLHRWRTRLRERASQLAQEKASGVQPAGFEPEKVTEDEGGASETGVPAGGSTEDSSAQPSPAPPKETLQESESNGAQG